MRQNQFQKELDNLERLLNRLNKTEKKKNSMSGGANSNVNTDDDSGSRHFKLLSVNGKFVDYTTRYDLPNLTKSGKPQKRGPKDMAKKAFSQLCRRHKKEECSYKFAIVETTRGSKNKEYHYFGKRVKLSKPKEITDKNGKIRVYKFNNELTSMGSSEHISSTEELKGGFSFLN